MGRSSSATHAAHTIAAVDIRCDVPLFSFDKAAHVSFL